MYDVIIIGAGPAGITASVYAARKKMSVLVLSKDIGGQAAWSGDIENYTGYQFVSGPELAAKFEEHMRMYTIDVRQFQEVTEVVKEEDHIRVKANQEVFQSQSVIIASGKRTRELHVPGEKEFKNKGVTYCATCDGPLFAGKDVVVVGGGNSALDAGLQLAKIARFVYVVNSTSSFQGDVLMQQKLIAQSNVKVLHQSVVESIQGNKFVESITVRQDAQIKQLPVQGVFVEIGLIPNSEFVVGVNKNSIGEIIIDGRNQTNQSGIFAAGDVTNVVEKQIIIAAGEGAKALLSCFRYIMQKEI